MYTHITINKFLIFIKKNYNYSKKFLHHTIIIFFCSPNIRMVNGELFLSSNDLRLIAEHRNISNYKNKCATDLIEVLRGSRPRLGYKKNKLKEIKEDFYNLMHVFSKKDADKYRKVFYVIKNYRHLSEQEIEEIRKKFNKLEKSLNFKSPVIILILFIMKILIVIKSLMWRMLMMINIEKWEVLKDYLKSLIEIIINQK